MGLGLMNKPAKLCRLDQVKDSEGFSKETEVILADIRVYIEGRHGSERWANLATFSEATDLFRFRKIPNLNVTSDLYIIFDNHRYNILSVENIRGRGLYLEVLAKKVESTSG